MYLTRSQKNKILHLIVPAFIVCLILPSFTPAYLTVGQITQNYTYYGVVPDKIYRYILNDWNEGGGNAWTNLSSGWSIATSSSNYLGGSFSS